MKRKGKVESGKWKVVVKLMFIGEFEQFKRLQFFPRLYMQRCHQTVGEVLAPPVSRYAHSSFFDKGFLIVCKAGGASPSPTDARRIVEKICLSRSKRIFMPQDKTHKKSCRISKWRPPHPPKTHSVGGGAHLFACGVCPPSPLEKAIR